ncbi:VanZ family protein [Accumulibacter sp.]|jgi:VanZ family protein|uniref:VanZ like protein n=1 Tax=Accumulibacter regalis TaxID=522306 RepID=C7RNR7_ACCRE|nr:VanZ family protein [Accumulibacter sp.]MBN8499136.1 VanZ family protein [Accumulibacter sp.]MBO3714203.1 VanZ family protein [Accumulibacter sp.]
MPTEEADFRHGRRWALALAALGIVLLFAVGWTPLAVGLFVTPWDKVAHVVSFGLLAGLLSQGLGRHRLAWAFLLAALVGGADELHQLQLPGRSADWLDFASDACGAAAGCTLSAMVPVWRLR